MFRFAFRLSRIAFLFAVCFVFSVSLLNAQVTEDSRSRGGGFDNAGVTSVTWSHAIGSGSNRALYVTVAASSLPALSPVCQIITCPTLPLGGAVSRVTGVTYNGVAMQLVPGGDVTNVEQTVAIYRLLEADLPTAGSYNVVVSIAPGTSTHAVGNALSFSGVNQMNPSGAVFNGSGNSNSPTVTVTDSAAGDKVLDILASVPNAGFFMAGMGQTVCLNELVETTCSRGRGFFSNAYDVGASSTKAGAASPVTMNWTYSQAGTFNWIIAATSVKAFSPTAGFVAIGGRLVTSQGRGVGRVQVNLTNTYGEILSATTNPFGYYYFEGIAAGEIYTLSIESKQYFMAPQSVFVGEELGNLDFVVSQKSILKKPKGF